ncbi:GNAT family N-acetyltransferase [Virgibacillus sp. DJP39]|uniref:GNAT family N-acetyltransferase n=1 Tax=Virgibacillus sp. DJP39 TaxID=3409790 RepID=UPI003BB619E5
MKRYEYQFTNRMKRIIELASQHSDQNVILPSHLFLAACEKATGVCGELHLYLHKKFGSDFINVIQSKCESSKEALYIYYNQLKLSETTVSVFNKANEKKESYNQVLINEGHILQSIFEIDENMAAVFNQEIIEGIVYIACVPRDMIVDLKSYHSNAVISYQNSIRRANHSDLCYLKEFIKEEFGKGWLEHIDNLQTKDNLPIFVAESNKDIIGFACFDIVRNKKGLLGPMGTSNSKRLNSVGRELLHRSLKEMADVGYEYAIIGQAGPIEFYERVCNAKLIPNLN